MCRPPFPKGAVVRTTMHATHISQCFGQSFGLPDSPRQHNSNALQYPGCVYVAARKPNSQRGWEKARTFHPPNLFTSEQCLISDVFCNPNRQTTSYGGRFPQSFTKIFHYAAASQAHNTNPAFVSMHAYTCAPRCCDWCSFKGKCSRVQCCTHFVRAGVYVFFSFLYLVCSSGVLVCANSK